jgi:threonine/homoserine/homoserine lactone efflux protein
MAVAFLLGFLLSFVGSIPPGSLNLSIVQLGLEHRINVAWRFAIAAALIEYPYAWMAVAFEEMIVRSPSITSNIGLISAVVLILLGIINLRAAGKVGKLYSKFSSSGFRRGVLLSILNPLALPFWIGVTAYLKSINAIDLSTQARTHSYLLGVSLGALALLMCLAYLARKMVRYFQENTLLKKIPGITLLLMGLYGLLKFFL